jgi:hypothetical protein
MGVALSSPEALVINPSELRSLVVSRAGALRERGGIVEAVDEPVVADGDGGARAFDDLQGIARGQDE